MRLNSIKVSGEYGLRYDFKEENVLLGANTTGKTTFVKLILYALGVDVLDFIEEIAEYKYCESVSLHYTTKKGQSFCTIRKLPYADIVMVVPYDIENDVMNDEEVQVFNLEEYSNFLLAEEGYPGGVISYGNGNKASLRYKFLLRTAVVDQSTEHKKILANLGASNDYIANQTLINKAIIEKILSQNNEEAQLLRLELNAKTKERSELLNKQKFYKEIINEYKESDEKWPMKVEKIQAEIEKIDQERDELSTEKYKVLLKLEQQGDKVAEKTIVELRKELNLLKEKQAKCKLELVDIDGILKKLSSELLEIKKNIAAKKVIQNIPVTICPVCFSKIDVDVENGLCKNCKEHDSEQILQSLAMYKKMIEESLIETESLKTSNNEILAELKKSIAEKEKKLITLENKYYEKLTSVKQPMETLIREIKDRLELLTERYYKLVSLKKNIVESNKLKSAIEQLTKEVKQIREDLEEASKKNEDDLIILFKWKQVFKEIFTEISGTNDRVDISEEDYMPLVNGNPMNKVSSESMKVVVRLSYILSLFKLQNYLDGKNINNIGFVIFDSPKDKDLDKDKYERFLKCLTSANCGQIFLTGSDKDEESYINTFKEEFFLPKLSDDDKLLKVL